MNTHVTTSGDFTQNFKFYVTNEYKKMNVDI